jgi:3-hydroxyisobutyrate dehydrogenase-like beta-hydroxyacid dehydrogenase
MTDRITTVGVLHVGEMGAAVAAVLRSRGARVVTTVAGRSQRTAGRCREAGVEVLDSLADVVRVSDVVMSLVPPASAEQLVNEYCEHAHVAPAGAVYVEMNSIGPELCAILGEKVERAGCSFVDAAINGLAKNLTTSGTLFLSGPGSEQVAALFGGAVRTRMLGEEIGRASAMKMLLAGVSKGVCALFVELGLAAQRREMLTEMLEASSQIYPGIMQLIDRMLPTYALHAPRRAMEMNELQETLRAADLEPCVVDAVRRLHESLAEESFDTPAEGNGWTVASLIQHLQRRDFLAAEELASPKQTGK